MAIDRLLKSLALALVAGLPTAGMASGVTLPRAIGPFELGQSIRELEKSGLKFDRVVSRGCRDLVIRGIAEAWVAYWKDLGVELVRDTGFMLPFVAVETGLPNQNNVTVWGVMLTVDRDNEDAKVIGILGKAENLKELIEMRVDDTGKAAVIIDAYRKVRGEPYSIANYVQPRDTPVRGSGLGYVDLETILLLPIPPSPEDYLAVYDIAYTNLCSKPVLFEGEEWK